MHRRTKCPKNGHTNLRLSHNFGVKIPFPGLHYQFGDQAASLLLIILRVYSKDQVQALLVRDCRNV